MRAQKTPKELSNVLQRLKLAMPNNEASRAAKLGWLGGQVDLSQEKTFPVQLAMFWGSAGQSAGSQKRARWVTR